MRHGLGMMQENHFIPIENQPLIDVHAHILPGIDDGPRDDAQALQMLRIAAEDGISAIVATPHAHHTDAAAVRQAVSRLDALAKAEAIPVTILPGSEVRIGPGIAERHRDGEILSIAEGPYLLIELYLHDEWPLQLVERALERVITAGLRPVLAHVERYPFVQRNPRMLLPLIERGIPLQINAGALTFREHDIERLTAETLLRARMVHVIASDAHNPHYRPPRLRAALAAAVTCCGESHVGWMVETAKAIGAGATISLPEPVADCLDAHGAGRG
jgi:protein-tyrosine phosphatase